MTSSADPVFDLAIIGGGVNGAGIARDGAGRGAKVILFEAGDLAGATSSRSTKLVHGGLRYLEHYAFRLVREALEEREVIWGIAPHIVWPMRFVLPYHRGLRPTWMLRAGLLLYDHLGGRKRLPASRALDLMRDGAGAPLQERFARGFEYSDCWVDDARLVALNARDAANRGAQICVRERVTNAARADGLWRVTTEKRQVRARALVNASGAWVARTLAEVARLPTPAPVRLVRGSHIVTKKLYAHDRAYMLQNADGRIVFVIPYERDFTLIGTTDEDFQGDPDAVHITDAETAYLCAAVSEYFRTPVAPADVVWSYSGVRPLYDDGASAAKDATRDYVLKVDNAGAPALSVFGGKITTYRRLAEHALAHLAPMIPAVGGPGWTGASALPGGDFDAAAIPAMLADWRARWPFLTPAHAQRLLHAYGQDTLAILGDARSLADLGHGFGADLTEREVRHLINREWARTAEDVLWRRTKLGLRVTAADASGLEAFMRANAPGDGAPAPAAAPQLRA
jgi:glycerol-3-phosphate dehydrogenase